MATAEQILALARQELGYKESPVNSNRTKYGKWYGLDGNPWCMMFVMWLFGQAEAASLLPARTASCSAFLTAAKKAGNWRTKAFLPGDIVIFDFPGNKAKADHVGIVEEVGDDGSYFFTIEGNTSTGDNSNGGMVMRRKRKLGLILGGFRPAYELVTPDSVPEEESASTAADAVQVSVGDLATFTGGSQFSDPYDDAEAVPASACTARIEAYEPGTAHPFRLSGKGVTGWADLNDVEIIPPEIPGPDDASDDAPTRDASFEAVVTAKPSLRIRSGPGVEYTRLGSLKTGASVTIERTENNWGKLSGVEGWIHLKYVKRK